ncbi:MAG: signal peptidase II [Lachnospiraceae bacterium]|nr:signal peptidase II [Lachnospiraceae bacterium]MDY5741758.1 signal peptidase II [Lachnospiraceae bacterium]
MKRKLPLLVLGTFLIDRVTKQQVELGYWEDQSFLQGKIAIEHHENVGLALGAGRDEPGTVKRLSVLGMAAVFGLYAGTDRRREKLSKAGLALMLGGGLGNFYDRLKKGAVTDFLRLPKGKGMLGKIIFNAADLFILLGGFLTLLGRVSAKKSG